MKELAPNMNVTPLVDVCLVLLIIFMVVIPRMVEQVPVNLPAVFNPDPKYKHQLEPTKITINSVGQYYLEDRQYQGVETMGDTLSLLYNETPDRRLLIKADASLEFGKIRPVLEKAQDIGFKGTGLVVGTKHKPEAKE